MHNLFLGELRHHCMEIWGVDIKDKPPSGQKVRPHTPEEQERELGKAVRALRKCSSNALDKLRKGYIVAIAKLNDVLLEDKKLTKAAYIKSLIKWTIDETHPISVPTVLNYDTTDFHLQSEGPTDISKFRVLSYDILQTIRHDIGQTHLPSWLQRPPSNFGSASHGKLKADQWRTVCTVSMVITLFRLWSSPNASQHDKDLLDNFLHLVSAVDLASRRSMSQDRAAAYDEHMYSYLRGLQELFDHQFVPNHHLSLHLYECLVLFGAVNGWWAFPFERYNGLIGMTNTNNKTADMPITFLRYFYCRYIGVNLRVLMASMKWPDNAEYSELMESYRQAFGEATYGTRVVDALVFGFGAAADEVDVNDYDQQRQQPLPISIYNSILHLINASGSDQFTSAHGFRSSTRSRPPLSPFGQPVGNVTRRNVVFATREKGLRNSFVVFHDAHSPDGLQRRAGQIAQIYLHSRTRAGKAVIEPFLVIDAYERLSAEDAAKDPYRRWPDINTQLYYNRFQSTPCVVRMEDVVSHFAVYVYRPDDIYCDCIVVRDLDRVSHFCWLFWTPQLMNSAQT
ncbi:hypothetical protein C8T65DRAFT_587629 [Cerioporus squamosus]|nr:hypothetical protein C8T65DRAFT_587629 [Cerioporus squamosus]